mmetsp:Transcript_35712/g.44316  ORF Transcript_35712/g.44316 Transcript_35712/m.44316 type:complete len:443 (-) Transcript_35712:336-1664(-)
MGTSKKKDKHKSKKKRKRKDKDRRDDDNLDLKRRKKEKKSKKTKTKKKERHKEDRKRKSYSTSGSDSESSSERRQQSSTAEELFRMIRVIIPSAANDVCSMLSVLDRGQTVVIENVQPANVKELLGAAFRKLSDVGVKEVSKDHFRIESGEGKTKSLLSSFQQLFNENADAQQNGSPNIKHLKQAKNASKNINDTPEESRASARTLGPSMPTPDYKNAAQQEQSENDSSDSEGPQPIGAAKQRLPTMRAILQSKVNAMTEEEIQAADPNQGKLKRGEWMTALPEKPILGQTPQLDQRPRGFKTSKQIKNSPNDEMNRRLWTQTPNESDSITAQTGTTAHITKKQKKTDTSIVPDANLRADNETRKRMSAFNDKSRGVSLMDQHKAAMEKSTNSKDPKKFSWDRDRDMMVPTVDPKNTKAIVEGADTKLYNRFSAPSSSRQFL